MPRITLDLIRKKAEHHDEELQTLEEISLHQLNLERLEVIASVAPRLRILYLQNNLIPKIENVSRLKSLEYLNLALNNVNMIEGLSSCEKLRKLDLTLNFISTAKLRQSLENLCDNRHLAELHLTGNPCTQWPHYRMCVIGMLPSLVKLDGSEINKSDRIQAKQMLPQLVKELVEIEQGRLHVPNEASSAYTPEMREEMYREEVEKEKKRKEDSEAASKFKPGPDLMKEAVKKLNKLEAESSSGQRPSQRNTGRYPFNLKDDGSSLIAEIGVPKFMDTSLINVDIHPTWLQCLIRDKALLLHLDEEVQPDRARIHRLTSTGQLILTMPKVNPAAQIQPKKLSDEKKKKQSDMKQQPQPAAAAAAVARKSDPTLLSVASETRRSLPATPPVAAAVAVAGAAGAAAGAGAGAGRESDHRLKALAEELSVDLDEVPPLD